jgi:hypothetical protein
MATHTKLFSAGLATLSLAATAATTADQQPASGGAVMVMPSSQSGPAVGGQLTVDAFALESVNVGSPVKNAPYSAEATTELIQVLEDGNRIVRRTSAVLYRDSRGRTRREVTLDSIAGIMVAGAPLRMITVSDPESGVTYSINPEQQQRTLRNLPPSASGMSGVSQGWVGQVGGASLPMQSSSAEHEESLGSREIEGISVDGTRTTVTIPAGAIGNERPIKSVTERWFSPALRLILLSRTSDPRFGTTTYRLTKITRTEPPASLFERPAQ